MVNNLTEQEIKKRLDEISDKIVKHQLENEVNWDREVDWDKVIDKDLKRPLDDKRKKMSIKINDFIQRQKSIIKFQKQMIERLIQSKNRWFKHYHDMSEEFSKLQAESKELREALKQLDDENTRLVKNYIDKYMHVIKQQNEKIEQLENENTRLVSKYTVHNCNNCLWGVWDIKNQQFDCMEYSDELCTRDNDLFRSRYEQYTPCDKDCIAYNDCDRVFISETDCNDVRQACITYDTDDSEDSKCKQCKHYGDKLTTCIVCEDGDRWEDKDRNCDTCGNIGCKPIYENATCTSKNNYVNWRAKESITRD